MQVLARFKKFTNPGLARKIAFIRAVSLLLGVAAVALVLTIAASGELLVRASSTVGGRFVSDGVLKTIFWSDSPFIYMLVTLWYIIIGLAVVAGLYVVLAKLAEKSQGRKFLFFKRKYPY